jgi:hypothetical protein
MFESERQRILEDSYWDPPQLKYIEAWGYQGIGKLSPRLLLFLRSQEYYLTPREQPRQQERITGLKICRTLK